MECSGGYCGRCYAWWKVLTGVLLLVNAFWWPRWVGVDGWVSFVAVLFVLGGLAKVLMPSCSCCAADSSPKKKR